MMAPLEQSGAVAAGAGVMMLVCWLVQQKTRDAGIVDAAWAAGLGMAAVFAGVTGAGDPGRRVLVAVIGGVWGLRLASHILFDRVLKGPEDGRYQMMRAKLGGAGARVSGVFFLFFQAQAVLVAILCWPFLMACADGAAFPRATDVAGGALWVIGIVGEWTADRQLLRWKAGQGARAAGASGSHGAIGPSADPLRHSPSLVTPPPLGAGEGGGGVCDVGLWRYSRHPNYFFEWLMWCAYGVLAVGYAQPWGWLALLAPAFMLVLVLKVTGIPPTEARSLKSRGEAYRRYQQTTSAFFPWFPKEAVR